jgi:formyl-CoA transferase
MTIHSDESAREGARPTAPLAGIRILELGSYIAAPYASSLLVSLGAAVVKVEPPVHGDAFRRGQGAESPYFVQYNTGKRSIGIDLGSPEGVELVRKMIGEFDVLLENLRPGKLVSLGLGPQVCLEINPRLVYVSVSGFGNGGALCDRPAYDSVAQSISGLYSLLNDEDEPRPTGAPLADMASGLVTAAGILAALVGQASTGRGSLVETSLMESVSAITADSMTQMFDTGIPSTRRSRHPQAQLFCVRTASGDFMTVHTSSSQKFWQRLTEIIERPELTDDPRYMTYDDRVANYRELCDIMAEAFVTRPLSEWQEVLTAADVPFAPVLRLDPGPAGRRAARARAVALLRHPPWPRGRRA